MVAAVLEAAADPEISPMEPGPLADPDSGRVADGRGPGPGLDRATGPAGTSTPPGPSATRPAGAVLGYVSLHDLEPRHLSGEVGYWVLPAARGRGVGRRAVAAASGYGFGALGLNRIELFHAVDNPSSCGVALGAGFALEGVAREAYRYGDGLLHDDHMHARLRERPAPRLTPLRVTKLGVTPTCPSSLVTVSGGQARAASSRARPSPRPVTTTEDRPSHPAISWSSAASSSAVCPGAPGLRGRGLDEQRAARPGRP